MSGVQTLAKVNRLNQFRRKWLLTQWKKKCGKRQSGSQNEGDSPSFFYSMSNFFLNNYAKLIFKNKYIIGF